jgi:hypothetical protein
VLQPSAKASCVESPSASESAFDLSFLVQRGQQSAFGKRVQALAKDVSERIDIRFVGPLPPYSFAEGNLEVGGP